jgi:hypothetical protein
MIRRRRVEGTAAAGVSKHGDFQCSRSGLVGYFAQDQAMWIATGSAVTVSQDLTSLGEWYGARMHSAARALA